MATITLKQRQLPLARDFLAIDQDRAAQDHQGGVTPFVQVQCDGFARVEAQVPHVDGRKGVGRALGASELTGDQAQLPGTVGQRQYRNVAIDNRLVTGVGHFVLGRQVDPQLHHLQRPAATGKRFGMELLVENAFGGSHPLHVAGADGATGAGGIAVFDFAIVDDGHGLKAAMRVLTDAATLFGRREIRWTGVIQQQEWADVLAHGVVGKQRAHRETVADPMAARAGVDADKLFHGVPPKCIHHKAAGR